MDAGFEEGYIQCLVTELILLSHLSGVFNVVSIGQGFSYSDTKVLAKFCTLSGTPKKCLDFTL